MDLDEVAVMALLHDVGEITGFDKERLASSGSNLESLLFEASGLASRRDERGLGNGDLKTPLRPIFDFVGPGSSQSRYHRLGEYGGKHMKPYLPATGTEGSYQSLQDAMVTALNELDANPDPNTVMNLLERYGAYLRPAAGGDGVSLFDHSRTTAAIAVCMAGHLNETEADPAEPSDRNAPRYLFVRGDISGVQKFIYTITSRGALRMLRARSFFLELVAEHAVAEILRRSGAPRTNALLSGGGGFQLLLPNTMKSIEAVETVKRALNADLEARFGHGLYLALAKASCSGSGIVGDGLTQTLASLGKDLSGQKARKFHDSLPRLLGERNEPGLESCDVCARDSEHVGIYDSKGYEPWRDREDAEAIALCETCRMLARASLKLVRNKYLVWGDDLHIGGTGYGLSSNPGNALYTLDGVGDEACLNGAVALPVARYMVQDQGQVMDFKELAKRAAGVSRLAVLRMDVDNLGETFRSGLAENQRTFDRYAALSRSFTTFFKMVVPLILAGDYENSLWLLGEKHERAATVVYSGGDDLFIVGAWSDVLELAVDIRRAFREFVCDNPSVTLSAGISIHKSGEPLYLMAEASGAAEETAKENKANGREKDSAILFYEGPDARKIENTVPDALFWNEVEGVVRLIERIYAFKGPDGKLPFPRGFTRLLLEVVNVYEQDGYLSLPKLAYALARMEEGGGLKENREWQELKRQLLEIETVEKHLRPAATWLDLAERKED